MSDLLPDLPPDLLHLPRVYLAGRVTELTYNQACNWRTTATKQLRERGVLGLNPMRDTELLLQILGPNRKIPKLRDLKNELEPLKLLKLRELMNDIGQRCVQDVSSAHAILVNLAEGAILQYNEYHPIKWALPSTGTICEVGIARGRGIHICVVAFEGDPHLDLPVFAACITADAYIAPANDEEELQKLLLKATSQTASEAKKLRAKCRP